MRQTNLSNRDDLRRLRREMDEALKAVGERNGVAMTLGRCTYGGGAATFKLDVGELTEGGDAMTAAATAYKQLASAGLVCGGDAKPEHLFKVFRARGEAWKLVGFKPRATRLPVLLERVRDGKQFVVDEATLGRMILRSRRAA